MHNNHYKKLLVMTGLSFLAMYILMYAMVDTFSNVFPNVNQFYMAALMAMPMIAIELSIMGGMYKNKQYNTVLIIASVLLMIAFFTFIRQQSAVGDKQFLKSMIPHHAAAILMCDKAPITDPEIKQLCESIISNQQSEINEMKRLLTR